MRLIAILAALVLVLAACGQSNGEVDSDGIIDSPGGDGEGEFVVGGDLDVPDWWPVGFDLPDGLAIRQASHDPAGQKMTLSGVVEGGNAAAIQEAMIADLQASGYEFLTDAEGLAVFIRDGVGRVRVKVADEQTSSGSAAKLSVDIDLWNDSQVEELRLLFAEEVVSRGTATAVVDGTTLEAEGECRLKGRNYTFAADDISIFIEMDSSTDPITIYADITTSRDGESVVYVVDTELEPRAEVTSETAPVSFSAAIKMYDYNVADAPRVDVLIEANCS